MPTPSLALAPPTVPDPMDAPGLRWGVLGPGGIANTFAAAVRAGTRSEVVAVGSRSADRASAFAGRHGVARSYGSYEELVADERVDVVYVASPHSEHHEHALLALRAGKHVLVEKAFCRNLAETDEVLDEARSGGLFAGEAMWSRYLPQYDVARRTVAAGTLGQVAILQADHGQRLWPEGPRRLSDPALAGGSLLDLGVYPIAFADHVLGPLEDVAARGVVTDEGVDATVGVTARVGGALARLTSTMAARTPCHALVAGSAALLELTGPGYFYGAATTVRLVAPDGSELDTFAPPHPEHGFRYQVAEIARALEAGRTEPWSVPWEATRRVMAVMDDVRRQVGVGYPGE
ncbi:Gfo/Idh/MocA family oxidoreductase [Phycicoccus endophyticus]|uniref:Gfo/Idh/MocA family oxidoreductase n=1 Tax=Phycicoccus endophyticus TaxID=1690220 RepID=A0A7G9QYY1_9MICO|nr:Gfo/Idh/MocA family oxidoreductase [Phycicoccus endophyticus]NHI18893.1 Gfo/Idh/MocA family oxidoreductase [Phycicoccus endophyticus]QNN48556.1 Gfo/Idh/MocA family oxidoreductase [Phycicoccus endophyticus]GGL31202.1 dehydrogenase [Phycicoccus endophyticus]